MRLQNATVADGHIFMIKGGITIHHFKCKDANCPHIYCFVIRYSAILFQLKNFGSEVIGGPAHRLPSLVVGMDTPAKIRDKNSIVMTN